MGDYEDLQPQSATPAASADSEMPCPETLETLRRALIVLAMRRLGDAPLAEDIAQETIARFLEAWRAGRVRDQQAVAPYVRRIALNVIADHHRLRHRQGRPVEVPTPTPHPSPLERLLQSEAVGQVRAALRTLSEADQRILRLSFVEVLTPSEIAERLDEPAPRIRKRKQRALARLRALLIRESSDDSERGRHEGDLDPTNRPGHSQSIREADS